MRGGSDVGSHRQQGVGRRFRVQDGKVVERWGRTDDLGFLQQLGIVPAPSS
jgi:hypothetical protein